MLQRVLGEPIWLEGMGAERDDTAVLGRRESRRQPSIST
jgi:hypothetical protein